MSISSIGSAQANHSAKIAAPHVANDQSKFKAGLTREAAAAQKSSVQVAQPAAASVHLKA